MAATPRNRGLPTAVGCWVRFAPPPANPLRLFCFPFAGAAANYFRSWPAELPAHIDLLALQLPGRGLRMKEPLITDIDTAVAHVLADTIDLLDRPYAFFGHSMGALLAYELSHRLSREGHPLPRHIVVSGSLPAQLERLPPFVQRMNETELLDELHLLGGTPPEVLNDRELIRYYMPMIRADFQILENYRWRERPPLPVNTSIWAGAQDPRVPVGLVHRWHELFSGESRLSHFPGGHMFIDRPSTKSQCLAELGNILQTLT